MEETLCASCCLFMLHAFFFVEWTWPAEAERDTAAARSKDVPLEPQSDAVQRVSWQNMTKQCQKDKTYMPHMPFAASVILSEILSEILCASNSKLHWVPRTVRPLGLGSDLGTMGTESSPCEIMQAHRETWGNLQWQTLILLLSKPIKHLTISKYI